MIAPNGVIATQYKKTGESKAECWRTIVVMRGLSIYAGNEMLHILNNRKDGLHMDVKQEIQNYITEQDEANPNDVCRSYKLIAK